MTKYKLHSNRTRSRLVPAPKFLNPLIVAAGTNDDDYEIVAAGTIRAGTVIKIKLIKNCYLLIILKIS